jgi:hypothetical protein
MKECINLTIMMVSFKIEIDNETQKYHIDSDISSDVYFHDNDIDICSELDVSINCYDTK